MLFTLLEIPFCNEQVLQELSVWMVKAPSIFHIKLNSIDTIFVTQFLQNFHQVLRKLFSNPSKHHDISWNFLGYYFLLFIERTVWIKLWNLYQFRCYSYNNIIGKSRKDHTYNNIIIIVITIIIMIIIAIMIVMIIINFYY